MQMEQYLMIFRRQNEIIQCHDWHKAHGIKYHRWQMANKTTELISLLFN